MVSRFFSFVLVAAVVFTSCDRNLLSPKPEVGPEVEIKVEWPPVDTCRALIFFRRLPTSNPNSISYKIRWEQRNQKGYDDSVGVVSGFFVGGDTVVESGPRRWLKGPASIFVEAGGACRDTSIEIISTKLNYEVKDLTGGEIRIDFFLEVSPFYLSSLFLFDGHGEIIWPGVYWGLFPTDPNTQEATTYWIFNNEEQQPISYRLAFFNLFTNKTACEWGSVKF